MRLVALTGRAARPGDQPRQVCAGGDAHPARARRVARAKRDAQPEHLLPILTAQRDLSDHTGQARGLCRDLLSALVRAAEGGQGQVVSVNQQARLDI